METTKLHTNKHGPRVDGPRPSMLIVHSIGLPFQRSLDLLTTDPREVSAHYAVALDGEVFSLVPEERRAWHAGNSSWRGLSDINSLSIGIELICPGPHDTERREEDIPGPFAPMQMRGLISLMHEVAARWKITADNILGHNDIAPGRKRDPGERFDWAELARAGLGLWPEPVLPDPFKGPLEEGLARFGYDVTDGLAAIIAFQRHFRPSGCTGETDTETRQILAWLLMRTER